MKKYKKTSLPPHYALQYTGENRKEIEDFRARGWSTRCIAIDISQLKIGDWAVIDSNDDFIVFEDDESFKKLYMPMEESETQKQES